MTGVGCHAVIALYDRLRVIGGEDLERRTLGRRREGVRVLAQIKWPVDALVTPIVANGLRNGRDV